MNSARPVYLIIQEAILIAENPDMLTDGPTSRRVIMELVRELIDPECNVQRLLAQAVALSESFEPPVSPVPGRPNLNTLNRS